VAVRGSPLSFLQWDSRRSEIKRRPSAADPGRISVGRQQVAADDAVGGAAVVTGSPQLTSARSGDSLDGIRGDLDRTGGQAWDEIAEGDGGGGEPSCQELGPGGEPVASVTAVVNGTSARLAAVIVVAPLAMASIPGPTTAMSSRQASAAESDIRACVVRDDPQGARCSRRQISHRFAAGDSKSLRSSSPPSSSDSQVLTSRLPGRPPRIRAESSSTAIRWPSG